MFEYIVLGMVLREPLTGYDIKKKIETGIGNLIKASHGSLYPALKKLTDKGYLAMNEQMQGQRIKKYYMATEIGETIFLEWLSLPFDQNINNETHLAKIFLFGELPKEIRIKRLQEYEFYFRQMLQQLQSIKKQLSIETLSDRDYFQISTFYFSYQTLLNTIRWVEYIKEQKPLSEFIIDNGKGEDDL